ncbi:MAG: hypothetical protein SYC29_14285 [Planctomycetota bacterium]|nr:hypothetical protein [Planctomycetota bacterium]
MTSAWRWDYERFLDQCRAHGVDPPRCLVDTRLVRPLRRVPQQTELLESEVIRDPAIAGNLVAGVTLAALGLAVLLFGRASWNCCAVPGALLMFAGAALALTEVGQAFSNSANEARQRLVACGVFATPKMVMLPADTLTVVRADRSGVGIDLANSQGRLRLSFRGVSSPGFIDFWQRWMHPRPRPELWGGESRL